MHAANRQGLSLTNLTVQRGQRTVLQDVSVTLGPGEILAIVGPNGAGKTTLLDAVLGAVPLTQGELQIDGRPVQRFAERARSFVYLAAEAEPALEMEVERWVMLVAAASDPGWSALGSE